LEGVEEFLTSIINNPQILEDFMDVLRGVIGVLRSVIEIFTQAFLSVLNGIIQFFVDNPEISQTLLTGLQEFMEWILGIPQWFEDAGSAFFDLGQDIGGWAADTGSAFYDLGQDIGRFGFNVGQFFTGQPLLLAEGGIVRRPTLAIVGESGPEAVIPLNEMARRTEELGGGGTKSITVVVNGVTDIPRLARRIRDEVEFL
jgi:hypothetical protein